MKKFIAVTLSALFALSAPLSGLAAVTQTAGGKKIYSAAAYQSNKLTYSAAYVKNTKTGADKKEYIKTEISYPKFVGYSAAIKEFNEANKENARKLSDDFIKEYTKAAKKYHKNDVSRTSSDEVPYSIKVEYSIKFNEDSVVSVFYTTTTIIAGVKTVEYSSQNFDFVTGKDLTVDDVSIIPQEGETMQLVLDAFKAKIRNGRNIYKKDAEVKEEDIQFYFEDKSITFFVNPGVLADESRGIVTYKLLDDAARTYLEKKVR